VVPDVQEDAGAGIIREMQTARREHAAHLSARRRLAIGSVVAVALAGTAAGTALACDGGGGARAADGARAGSVLYRHHDLRRHRSLAALLPAVTSYLGVPRAPLVAQLRAGKTLAEIADATPGKSSAGLVAAIVKSVQTKLDAAVASGKLTQSEEQRQLDRLAARVKFLVDGFPMVPLKPGPQ
jgi:hypothetical protein